MESGVNCLGKSLLFLSTELSSPLERGDNSVMHTQPGTDLGVNSLARGYIGVHIIFLVQAYTMLLQLHHNHFKTQDLSNVRVVNNRYFYSSIS